MGSLIGSHGLTIPETDVDIGFVGQEIRMPNARQFWITFMWVLFLGTYVSMPSYKLYYDCRYDKSNLLSIMGKDDDKLACPVFTPDVNIRTFEVKMKQHMTVRAGMPIPLRYKGSTNVTEARLYMQKEMDYQEIEMRTFPYLHDKVFQAPYEYLRQEFYNYVMANPPARIRMHKKSGKKGGNKKGEDSESEEDAGETMWSGPIDADGHWLRYDITWQQKLETLMKFIKSRTCHEDFAEQMKVMKSLIMTKCSNLDNMSALDTFLAKFNMDLCEVKKLPCQGWVYDSNSRSVVQSKQVNSTMGESVPGIVWALIAFIGASPNRDQTQKLIMSNAKFQDWPHTEGIIRRFFRQPHELSSDASKSKHAGYSAVAREVPAHEQCREAEADHYREAYYTLLAKSETGGGEPSEALALMSTTRRRESMAGFEVVRLAADDDDHYYGTDQLAGEETVWEECLMAGAKISRFPNKGRRNTFVGKAPRMGSGMGRCYVCQQQSFDRTKKACTTASCGHKAGDKIGPRPSESASLATGNLSKDWGPQSHDASYNANSDEGHEIAATATAYMATARPADEGSRESYNRQGSLTVPPRGRAAILKEQRSVEAALREHKSMMGMKRVSKCITVEAAKPDENGWERTKKRLVCVGDAPSRVRVKSPEPYSSVDSEGSEGWSEDVDMAESRAECKQKLASCAHEKKTPAEIENVSVSTSVVKETISWTQRVWNFLWTTGCVISYLFTISILVATLGVWWKHTGPSFVQACQGDFCGHAGLPPTFLEDLESMVVRLTQDFQSAEPQQ